MIHDFDTFFYVDYNGATIFSILITLKKARSEKPLKNSGKSIFRFWFSMGWFFHKVDSTNVFYVKKDIESTYHILQNDNCLSLE